MRQLVVVHLFTSSVASAPSDPKDVDDQKHDDHRWEKPRRYTAYKIPEEVKGHTKNDAN